MKTREYGMTFRHHIQRKYTIALAPYGGPAGPTTGPIREHDGFQNGLARNPTHQRLKDTDRKFPAAAPAIAATFADERLQALYNDIMDYDYVRETDSDADNTLEDYNDTNVVFTNAQKLTNPLLVRFSKKAPTLPLLGHDSYRNLGLTIGTMGNRVPDDPEGLAFAFPQKYALQHRDALAAKYGRYTYVISVPEALQVDHMGDDETQAIFCVTDAKLRNPLTPRESNSAHPTPKLKTMRLFHGTKTQKNADAIWREGIKPDLSETPDGVGSWRPVEGRVYLATRLKEAIPYCLGGAVAGHDADRFIKKYGQYGFMFVISGSDIQEIYPDEDQVGEAVSHLFVNDEDWKKFYTPYGSQRFKRFSDEADELHRLAEEYLADEWYDTEMEYEDGEVETKNVNLLEQVKGGEYDAFVRAGKILLPHLSDDLAIAISETYGNIAHEGSVTPTEMWRFDRSKSKQLKPDGSNFFELAEKIQAVTGASSDARRGGVGSPPEGLLEAPQFQQKAFPFSNPPVHNLRAKLPGVLEGPRADDPTVKDDLNDEGTMFEKTVTAKPKFLTIEDVYRRIKFLFPTLTQRKLAPPTWTWKPTKERDPDADPLMEEIQTKIGLYYPRLIWSHRDVDGASTAVMELPDGGSVEFAIDLTGNDVFTMTHTPPPKDQVRVKDETQQTEAPASISTSWDDIERVLGKPAVRKTGLSKWILQDADDPVARQLGVEDFLDQTSVEPRKPIRDEALSKRLEKFLSHIVPKSARQNVHFEAGYTGIEQAGRIAPAVVLRIVTAKNKNERTAMPFLKQIQAKYTITANEKKMIARWESRGGKYWVELYSDHMGYSYQADGGGGNLGKMKSDDDAIEAMEKKIGYLTPDAHKNLLKRTK